MVIDGNLLGQKILKRLRIPSDKFLAAVVVGEDPASLRFIKKKQEIGKACGIDFRTHAFSEHISSEELEKKIEILAEDSRCGGIIVQLPLPASLNREEILSHIPVEKDVDVLRGMPVANISPPSVGVVREIAKELSLDFANKVVAVLGAGFLVGKPISIWLKLRVKELIIINEGDSMGRLREADIVISGVGKSKLFSAKQLKSGAAVIDFGISLNSGRIEGDFDSTGGETAFYTPTPGGTGPILIAKLFENFCILNQENRS